MGDIKSSWKARRGRWFDLLLRSGSDEEIRSPKRLGALGFILGKEAYSLEYSRDLHLHLHERKHLTVSCLLKGKGDVRIRNCHLQTAKPNAMPERKVVGAVRSCQWSARPPAPL